MKTYLFQGDSITDAGRVRDHDNDLWAMGFGYPNLVSAYLSYNYPGEYKFYNKGISGDRSVDIYARIKRDIINLKPDYMSILMGINDIWHDFGDSPNGVDTDKFEKIYSMLIEEIKEALPNIKIIILEPFVLKGFGTEKDWDGFSAEITGKAAAAKRVAEKYGLKFISLKKEFEEISKGRDASIYLMDGVHPNSAGHALIAEKLIKVFEEIK